MSLIIILEHFLLHFKTHFRKTNALTFISIKCFSTNKVHAKTEIKQKITQQTTSNYFII